MNQTEAGRIAKPEDVVPPAQDSQLADDRPDDDASRCPPVVGVGASAGGLLAFEQFFAGLPEGESTGMAFVLVQHLAPHRKSLLAELVKRHTRLDVSEIEDGMQVVAEGVYVAPPDCEVALSDGRLGLSEATTPQGHRLPIDSFLASLARAQGERAMCVILSGAGSDGTRGLREVNGGGGLVVVQDPATADHESMPRSALATGLVDYALPPSAMLPKLIAYVRHAFQRGDNECKPVLLEHDSVLEQLLGDVHARTGRDFSQYKRNTVVRRVQRRMALQHIERATDYRAFARDNPGELDALQRDLLIGVTAFFRDPESFAALQEHVLERLVASKPARGVLRAWVCGCSTGEEAFSIAILLRELVDKRKQPLVLQIFATDLDVEAVERARRGVFLPSIAREVSPARLERFFDKQLPEGSFRIKPFIRDLVVFSVQDVTKDPPFSNLDFLVCRNLLIYMNNALQKRLFPLFHYALLPNGVLFLGSSETIGQFSSLFTTSDRKHRIYLRRSGAPAALEHLSGTRDYRRPPDVPTVRTSKEPSPEEDRVGAVMKQALVDHYANAAVLVDEKGTLLHVHGRTGRYLEPPAGDATLNVLQMAREGLGHDLTVALQRARTQAEPVIRKNLEVFGEGATGLVDLVVKRLARRNKQSLESMLFLVVFEDAQLPRASDLEAPREVVPGESGERVAALQHALQVKEEYLQTTLEEMETSNEELKSANEELQSVNEELQSTNEEMETSKEELQSVNEELATVNAELQDKVGELSLANNDMNNLLAGTGVATLFVDHQLRIARFTPSTVDVINLIKTDEGRPVGDIASNLVNYDRLVEDVRGVLDTLVTMEAEVQAKDGHWYLMRIGPYRTLQNVIEGAVLTFVDITGLKKTQQALADARDFAQAIVATVRQPLVVLDQDSRVVSANRAFCSAFDSTEPYVVGRSIFDLGTGKWADDCLERLLEDTLPRQGSVRDQEVTYTSLQGGAHTLVLNAQRIWPHEGAAALVVVSMEQRRDPGEGLAT